MIVWLIFAAMTAAAMLVVLTPLGRVRAPAGGTDAAVYRDQLTEIDNDARLGLIGPAEAEAARIEVSRRLIAAAEAEAKPVAGAAARRAKMASIIALAGMPIVVAGVYGLRGQPDYPGQPLAARMRDAPVDQDIQALVARVEAHLAANPQDGRGWEVIAPVYLRLGRFADGARARANALRILGPTADRETDVAEALVLEAQGVVTAEAKTALARALALEANHPKARYFTGVAAEQDGRPQEAIANWTALLAAAPADAPWRDLFVREIARLGGAAPAPQTPAADPEQSVMIRGMVDRLAQRLATDAADFDGWLRLVRAWRVLGETDRARQAAAEARRHFAADPDKIGRIEALLRELGLEG